MKSIPYGDCFDERVRKSGRPIHGHVQNFGACFALDAMSGLQQQELTALDEWRARRARRSEGNS